MAEHRRRRTSSKQQEPKRGRPNSSQSPRGTSGHRCRAARGSCRVALLPCGPGQRPKATRQDRSGSAFRQERVLDIARVRVCCTDKVGPQGRYTAGPEHRLGQELLQHAFPEHQLPATWQPGDVHQHRAHVLQGIRGRGSVRSQQGSRLCTTAETKQME